MGTGSFPGVKRPGSGADPPTHLQCRGLKLGRAISLPALRALVACYRKKLFFYNPYYRSMGSRGFWSVKAPDY